MKIRENLKEIKRKIAKGFAYLGLGYFTCIGAMTIPALIVNPLSPKIESQSQLEQLIEQERKNINSTSQASIQIELISENRAGCKKLDDGTYKIEIGKTLYNESTLKHELYHIFRGHCENKYKNLVDFFWNEPTTALYESTGIKL